MHQSAKSSIIPLLVCLWAGRIALKCFQPYLKRVSGVSYYAGHSSSSGYYHPFSRGNMPGVCENLLSASLLLHGALPFLHKQTSFSSLQLVFRPLECSRLHISIGERFTSLSACSCNREGPPLWFTITILDSLVQTQLHSLHAVVGAAGEVLSSWSRKPILSSWGMYVCKRGCACAMKLEMSFPKSRKTSEDVKN